MTLPTISKCKVEECAFNRDEACHAKAITVGGPDPCCDTYFNSLETGGKAMSGSVGACKVTDCRHNDNLECSAPSIEVSRDKCKADCMTFDRM